MEKPDDSGASPGARLRELRLERGLSLNELSRLTHYSKGYLSKVETEEKRLTADVARRCDAVLESGGELRSLVTAAGEPVACPYRGLSAYGAEDSRWFFGREHAVGVLVGWLAERMEGPLAVVAPSGAGKSSLLRAGLLPAISRGALPEAGSRTWPVVLFTPGERPVGELTARIAAVTGLAVPALVRALAEGPAAFAAHVWTALIERGEERRLVLVVDQLEEIFTLCRDPVERRVFLGAVLALAGGPSSGGRAAALVVLGVRADFYGHCLAYPDLVAALREGQFPLGPMTLAELREVITGPARAAGLTLEPGLVELLLRDLGVPAEAAGTEAGPVYEPGALPLLSHALLTTWQQRRGDTLTVDGYRVTGGIGGAVAATAERVFARLEPGHQEIARRVLPRLVCVGEDDTLTRRPVDVRRLPSAHFPAEATFEVIESFARARLLTLDADHAQLAHEALLRAWPRLREWIHADRDGLRVHRQLAEAAEGWEREGYDPSLLYRGTRLRAARDWAASGGAALTEVEQRFLDAGLAGQAAEQAAAHVRARRRRQAVTGLAVLLALTLVATVVAVAAARTAESQRRLAHQQKSLALSRHLALQSESLLGTDPTTAQLLAVTAHRIAGTPDARRGMLSALAHPAREVLTGHTASVVSMAFSPDGRILASASHDRTVRLWDTATCRPLGPALTGHTGGVTTVAFSPDGRTLASAGLDRTVRLWDVATRRPLGEPLVGHTDHVLDVAFGPGGLTLASAGADRTVRLWDVATRSGIGEPLHGHTGFFNAVAFSPDGRTLAGAGDRSVRLWDPLTGRQIGRPLNGEALDVAFSPDGRTLAVAGDDEAVRLWDTATGRPAGDPLLGRADHRFGTVAFSSDGRTLAGGGRGADGAVLVWDVVTRRQVGAPLSGHAGWASGVAFSPDGRVLASAGGDRSVRLWDLVARRPVGVPLAGAGVVDAVAFSPDGRTLAGGGSGEDATVRLWDLVTRRPIGAPLAGHTGAMSELEFSPDRRTLVSADGAGVVLLWDAVTRRRIGPLTDAYASEAAFSPDGRVLVSASGGTNPDEDDIQLWDVATRRPLGAPLTDRAEGVTDVEFSPDGRTLAVASARADPGAEVLGNGGKVRLWDVATRRPIGAPLVDQVGGVSDVEFSPDGRVVAGALSDRSVRLWEVATGRPVGAPLAQHPDGVTDVEFSPDGRVLAGAGHDGTVRLWDVATRLPIGAPLVGHAGSVNAVAFSPDGRVLASGGDDGTVRLWDVAVAADPAAELCAIAGRSRSAVPAELTREEWERYLPGEPFQEVCPSAL